MTADAVGGVWTYCLELAGALDVEVHLALTGPPRDAAQVAESGVFADVHEGAFPLEWQDDPWAGVDAAGEWLGELAAELQPDVVHLNGYAHASLPWAAPVVVVAHSDVVSWWRAVHGGDPPPAWDGYRRRVSAGLRAADRVVAPTASVVADLAAAYGFSRTQVVPNCRRPDAVAPGVKVPVVLAAGRLWDAAKGVDALCRVAPRLPGQVRVAGDGAAPEGVVALGRLPWPALARELSAAAVYAAPARYEPFGLGALEAGLAGCALVLGDLPSQREVWGSAATYVGDDAALTAALTELLEDTDLAAARGAAARERALSHSPERTAAGYRAQYADLPVSAR